MKETSIGDQLDHYRIDELIASRNQASIYRATDLNTGAPVAIKIPHVEMETDPLYFERFRREEEIGLKLNHPGVMRVFPSEHHGRVYMVMEWVNGRSLRSILSDQGKLPQERATHIAIGICDAVAYIHSHGVIHRDLRPSHFMVDEHDHIKLISFGLASQVGAKRLTFTNLAQELHTVSYASPEELKGQRCDTRSDVYSIGVMLYEMLTGRLPFRDGTRMGQLNERLVKDPIPPRKLEPSITPQMQEIVLRALERAPLHRYSSAHELAHDLAHLQDVVIDEGRSQRNRNNKTAVWNKNILVYLLIALVPILLFILMMLAANRK